MGDFTNYNFGGEGVNLVKDPLQLADAEATLLQNVELVPDQEVGGEGALSKRGGLQPLNSTVLAGSVLGMVSLPLQTTFTRTLYALNNGQSSFTAYKTTDGTTWTGTALPNQGLLETQADDSNAVFFGGRRLISARGQILYPGTDYTVLTSFPPVTFFNGTDAGVLTRIPTSSAGANEPYGIVDMLLANGKAYIIVAEDATSGGVNSGGAVYELNLDSGYMKLVANAFGTGTNQKSGGTPNCLAWYQGRLWVGQGAFSTADGVAAGQLSSCYPDIDTTWTSEGSTFQGVPISLAEYKGDLFVGCYLESLTDNFSGVKRRASATGTITTSYTGSTSGGAHTTSLTVFNGELYGFEFHSSGTDILHIKKYDNSSWVTDLDVDSVHSAEVETPDPQYPGNMLEFGSKLYVVVRSLGGATQNGFILERTTGGTWTRVTDNKGFTGGLVTLVERT